MSIFNGFFGNKPCGCSFYHKPCGCKESVTAMPPAKNMTAPPFLVSVYDTTDDLGRVRIGYLRLWDNWENPRGDAKGYFIDSSYLSNLGLRRLCDQSGFMTATKFANGEEAIVRRERQKANAQKKFDEMNLQREANKRIAESMVYETQRKKVAIAVEELIDSLIGRERLHKFLTALEKLLEAKKG